MTRFVGMMDTKPADPKTSATKDLNQPVVPVDKKEDTASQNTVAPQEPVASKDNDKPDKVEVKPEHSAQDTKPADPKTSATKASK